MQEFPINWWAVLVAAIVKMAIGALWYSPLLFGPRWMALTGCTETDMKARLPRLLVLDFIASIIMAFVLVHAVHYAGARTLATGAAVGFFNWLGYQGDRFPGASPPIVAASRVSGLSECIISRIRNFSPARPINCALTALAVGLGNQNTSSRPSMAALQTH